MDNMLVVGIQSKPGASAMNENELGKECQRCGHDVMQHERNGPCLVPICHCAAFLDRGFSERPDPSVSSDVSSSSDPT